jgi:methylmalonyl-CoA mutase
VRSGKTPVIGITGTGGAGKSSVTDEILNRFLASFPQKRIAVLAVDPTRRRTGGALLGDRIRMNSLRSDRIYMRSIATRRQHLATSEMLADQILFLKSWASTDPGRNGRYRAKRQRDCRHGRFLGIVMTSDHGAASSRKSTCLTSPT